MNELINLFHFCFYEYFAKDFNFAYSAIVIELIVAQINLLNHYNYQKLNYNFLI